MKRQDRNRIESLKQTLRKQRQEVGAVEQLEYMLDAEMAKNPVDIDTDYADALAELILEYRNIPAAQSDPSAGKTVEMHRRKHIVRVAALIIILCGIILIPTARVANAFSWISIVKFFSPLMEQIGIHVNLEKDDELNAINKLDQQEPSIETVVMDEFVDEVIKDEKALPESVDGYPVHPPYLPDGFDFVRAELFENASMTNLNMTYSDGEQELYIQIKNYSEGIGVDVVMTEQQAEPIDESMIVLSSDEGINNATMSVNSCQYMAWGFIGSEELLKIMEEYRGVLYQ